MKKRILAVGDSFTAGEELEKFFEAWPYVLAGLIDADVYNLGQQGCSNSSIVRRTLLEITRDPDKSYDMAFIGWTSPGRIEWHDHGSEYTIWPGMPHSRNFIEYTPWRFEHLTYISKYHNVNYLYKQYLINVISLQSYFKTKNIPYIMINLSSNDYYHKTSDPSIGLADQIDKNNFLGWGTFGMIELTADYPKGPGHHPLTEGHRIIAEKIYEHTRYLGWLS